MVERQPPPSFLAPYPAIRTLNQLGIKNSLTYCLKKCAIGVCKVNYADRNAHLSAKL